MGALGQQPCRTPHGAARLTEVEVRAMLERPTGFDASVVEGRFMIRARHRRRPCIVIVEPDAALRVLVVVTVYEVSE